MLDNLKQHFIKKAIRNKIETYVNSILVTYKFWTFSIIKKSYSKAYLNHRQKSIFYRLPPKSILWFTKC